MPAPLADEVMELTKCSNEINIWSLFTRLILRLPPCAIFCVIDNLAFYHDTQEALFVLQGLCQLTREIAPHLVLKVLLTGPLPADAIGILSVEDILLLPADVEGDGQGFTLTQGSQLLNGR